MFIILIVAMVHLVNFIISDKYELGCIYLLVFSLFAASYLTRLLPLLASWTWIWALCLHECVFVKPFEEVRIELI